MVLFQQQLQWNPSCETVIQAHYESGSEGQREAMVGSFCGQYYYFRQRWLFSGCNMKTLLVLHNTCQRNVVYFPLNVVSVLWSGGLYLHVKLYILLLKMLKKKQREAQQNSPPYQVNTACHWDVKNIFSYKLKNLTYALMIFHANYNRNLVWTFFEKLVSVSWNMKEQGRSLC